MYWQGEPFRGAIVSRREIKGETVYAIVVLSEYQYGPRMHSEYQYGPLMHKGLPIIQMAVARETGIYFEADNAYNARSFKGRTFVLGRKRRDSPVEIVSIQ